MAAASLQDADPESPLLRSHPPLPLPMCEETGQGGRCGLPSPPAPLPRCRRGVSRGRGIVARRRRRVATSPLPFHLFRSQCVRRRGKGEGADCPHPQPLSRAAAALTPGPSPALRERGDCGLGIVVRRRRRVATAPLPSPSSAPRVGGDGAGGKVRAARRALQHRR